MGVLLGDASIHLIPDAVARQGSVSLVCLSTLAGVFTSFQLEKPVRWRHDHGCQGVVRPLARMNLIGDTVHNFVGGVLLAGSFLLDSMLGLTITLAIVIHEIPQELGDVGALIEGGSSPLQAVRYIFAAP